jgi:hypothetical protein
MFQIHARPSGRRFVVAAAGALLVATLVACGGGGGGGGATPPADNSWLTLQANPGTVETWAGESASFTVTASSSRTINETVYAAVIDRQGAIQPRASIVAETPQRYVATIATATTLREGSHDVPLEVRLCRDDPVTCANPYPGSPWQVTVRIVVRPATNLTPLAALAGAGPWATRQGNAAQTGFVAAELDPARFSRRWVQTAHANGVALADGRIHLSDGVRQGSWALRTLNEHDGSELWRASLGPVFSSSVPAWSDGRLFLATGGHADTALWSFDAATGQQLGRLPMNAQWPQYPPPTVRGGAVYARSGSYSGVSRVDAAALTLDWFAPALAGPENWATAVDDSGLYMLTTSGLWKAATADGATLWSINDVFTGSTDSAEQYHDGGTPVIGGGGLVYGTLFRIGTTRTGSVLAFDTTERRIAWRAGSAVRSNPVFTGTAVLLANGNTLQAHDPATGALLWQWTAPQATPPLLPGVAETTPLLAVGRHAFVGLQGRTHVVDMTTRQAVWSYPAVGALAVSPNGVLYIAAPDGRLVAVNLR